MPQLSIFLLLLIFIFKAELVNAEENTQNTSAETAMDDKNNQKNKTKQISAPIAFQSQYNDDLKHYFEKAEPLLVGTNEYITLFNSSDTANNKGVMILLPDWQQPVTSPKTLAYLRTALPKHGWSTLAIQPLDIPENYPSTAIKAAEQLQENSETIDIYKNKLIDICQALIKKTENMPGIFIFVTEGNNAGIILEVLQNLSENEQPEALIMLSAYRATSAEELAFANTLAMSEVPVLDLYLRNDHYRVEKSAELRKKHSEKELKISYRQKKLNNISTSYYPEKTLLKEIQGWLKSIGW